MDRKEKKLAIRIRKFRKEDARGLARVIARAQRITLSPYYHKKKIIEFFVKKNNSSNLLQYFEDAQLFLVAYEIGNRRIIGGITLKKDTIKRFFVDPSFQSKGVGKRLFQSVLRYALRNKLGKLRVCSTLYAVPVYKTFGFRQVGKERKIFNGVTFYNIKFVKKLL